MLLLFHLCYTLFVGDKMNDIKFDDDIKYMCSGYVGIKSLDDYERKVYILRDARKFIDAYVEDSDFKDFNFDDFCFQMEKEYSHLEHLQDALLLINAMNGPVDLILLGSGISVTFIFYPDSSLLSADKYLHHSTII